MRKILLPFIIIVSLVLVSGCTGIKYDRVDVEGYFSIGYPAGDEYIISPASRNNMTDEIDFQGEGVNGFTISVVGYNGAFSDIVDYDNEYTSWKGALVSRNDKIATFIYKTQTDSEVQNILLDCDAGDGRTITIRGTCSTSSSQWTDRLTKICADMGKSIEASPAWISDRSLPVYPK
jgi:hypothetical protein